MSHPTTCSKPLSDADFRIVKSNKKWGEINYEKSQKTMMKKYSV